MNLVLTASRNHMVPFRSVGNVLQYLNDQEDFSLKEFNTFLQLNCRQGLYYNYIVQLGYTQATLSDSLRFGNPAYFNNGKNYKQFLYAGFRFVSDYRDSRNYPLRGHYIEVHLNKQGFGILGNDNTDMLSAGINLKKFFRAAPRLHISAGSQAKISNRFFQPYYLQKGLGYGNQFIRGYEYYVIDGQSYAMYKTALKYTLIKNREFHISFIPSEKFSRGYYALYLNLFSDGGYVWDRQWGNVNPLSNLYLSSAGLGLDLVTYYDKVVRIEFSVNHMSESGLFLHFLAPI